MKLVAEQEGYTVCVRDADDTTGKLWCFRINKPEGAELVRRVNEYEAFREALQELGNIYGREALPDEIISSVYRP